MSFINKNIAGTKPPPVPQEIKSAVDSEELKQTAITTLLANCTQEELTLLARASEKPGIKALAISQLKNYL